MNFSDSQDTRAKTTIFKKCKKNNLCLIYLGKIAIFANTNGCYMPVVTQSNWRIVSLIPLLNYQPFQISKLVCVSNKECSPY